MKSKVIVLVAALGLAVVAGCASQENTTTTKSGETFPNSTNGAYLTGSNLPQDINRNGPVTDGRNNLRIIDNSDINRSGGANVGQTLRQLGVTP